MQNIEMSYNILKDRHNLELEGMPNNHIDYVDFTHIKNFLRFRIYNYITKCCDIFLFIIFEIIIKSSIPIAIYCGLNDLLLYIITSPIMIMIFVVHLYFTSKYIYNILTLLQYMEKSTILKPYIEKILYIKCFYLFQMIIYIICIVSYRVIVTKNNNFIYYTIAYTFVILLHVIASIFTIISEMKYCERFCTVVLGIIEPC